MLWILSGSISYQERVYKTLEAYFDGEEKDMLREATRPVGV